MVLSLIFIKGIKQDKPNEISMTFQCTWDEENGVGICLHDMDVEDIGYSSIEF